MSLKRIVGPKARPIDLDEVKKHCRIDATADDSLLLGWIEAANDVIEERTERALITQTWDLYLDRFPCSDSEPIWLPKSPVQSVTSIIYVDTNGAEQTWTSSDYEVDIADQFTRILPAYDKTWPDTRDKINAVRVRYIAGYGDKADSVPEGIRKAICFLLNHWYEYREPIIAQPGVTSARIPHTMDALFWQYRIFVPEQR